VLGPLGVGGMSEVYQARDARLGRDVAIKVLPPGLTDSPEYLARFEREARVVASLNHPNIAALYAVDDRDGVPYLVLELVPGQTFAELLEAGALPLVRALDLCRQIADAVEAAHARGVVHRDLKPSNVKVTPSGMVKVLDFGLAKSPGPEWAGADISRGSTATFALERHDPALSGAGLVGTLYYMCPEAVRGGSAHRQGDVWSFGCVLYEALAGRKAFEGPTSSDTIAAILERDPDWQALPRATPLRIRDLLRRCLRKDRHQRLHDIADARIEIEEALSELTTGGEGWGGWGRLAQGVAQRPLAKGGLGLGAAVVVALVTALIARPGERPPYRLHINLPATAPLAVDRQPAMAVSPDGASVVYVARRGSRTQLHLRRTDQFEATPLAGTEGGDSPIFSPDGAWIAFAAEGKLKKIAVSGGEAVTLCDAPAPHGLAWGAADSIYFAPSGVSGIHRVSAAGGRPEALTSPDSRHGEAAHRWPEALPGGRAILYTVYRAESESPADASIAVLPLGSGAGAPRILAEGATFPRYAPTGHLVYARSGLLFAVRLDLSRLEVAGPPVPVAEDVNLNPLSGAAQFSFSREGVLVYAPGGAQMVARSLIRVDRKGAVRPVTETRRAFFGPRLSPDRRRLALTVEDDKGFNVWVQDLERDTLTRLTLDGGQERLAVWTPDGRRLVLGSSPARRTPSLLWRAADGSDDEKSLTASGRRPIAGSVSPDGTVMAFTDQDPIPGGTGNDIWLLPLPEGAPQPYLRTPFDEAGPMFSPDGRWIAYTSNETGREEIYLRPFPGPGGKWQVSTEGGSEAVWSPSGREIFFRNGDRMMAVSLAATGDRIRAEKPVLLFEAPYDHGLPWYPNYDVGADGREFLMIRSEPRPAPTQLNVVLGWFSALRRQPTPPSR
jgi:serine/threonine-protein kinase